MAFSEKIKTAEGVNRSSSAESLTAPPLDFCILWIYTIYMMTPERILSECVGFDWNESNTDKSIKKHRVRPAECEQAFFNKPFVVADDTKHSGLEKRFYALGKTDAGRRLFIAFTARGKLIRIISARDMSRKERKEYQIYEKENSQL